MLTVKRLAIAGAAIALAVGMASCSSAAKTGTTATTTATPASRGGVAAFPAEGIPTTTTPHITVPALHLGDTANLAVVNVPVGETGAEAPRFAVDASKPTAGRLQIVRVKTTHGSDYDTPDRGLYLGAYVKSQSVRGSGVPGGLSWNLYVVVNGHHYDSTITVDGFKPDFGDVYLHPGETDEGWFVFDVPAAHGKVVLTDAMSDEQIATWTF
jgi:hypothetical protein